MTFPANFMFVAAMNPCSCGFFGDASQRCGCTPSAVARYKNRISGPLLDRIDLFVEVPRVEYEKLVQPSDAERSHQVRNRVEAARLIQQARFQGTDMVSNADMGPAQVWDYCKTDDAASNLLKAAVNQMKLSARGFHRILKVARTIADLSQVETIGVAQLAEALQYRPKGVE